MKTKWFSLCKICCSLGLIPLWFLKVFHGVGHRPSLTEPGTIERVDFYHSMLENLSDELWGILPFVSIGLLVLSAFGAVLGLILSEKRWLRCLGNVLFGVAVTVFLILFVWASSVARGY